MAHFINGYLIGRHALGRYVPGRQALHWIEPPVLIAVLWVSLAIATAAYDIGRWLSLW